MDEQQVDSNMELWYSYFKPHEDAVREGTRGLSAIDPMWMIRCATEKWGPMGRDWGFSILDSIIDSHGDLGLHTVLIELWYPDNGRIQSYGGTILHGINKRGPFIDDDAYKKSVTDALSKALSWLGFGAAVHMGMFDSNKYIDLRTAPVKGSVEKLASEEAPTNLAPLLTADGAKEKIKELANKGVDKVGAEEYTAWHNRAIVHITGEERVDDITNETALMNFLVAQREFLGKDVIDE